MDPISQGALGAVLAETVVRREKLVAGAWLGALAGMAPDLDVFIQSSHDPLLFLEFHRQFTHALIFIPIGALVVAAALRSLFRRHLNFRESYLVALAGYATHGLLDACTTYGTQLFWPFSDMRVAWNNVSVVDPAFTLPLLVLVTLAARCRRPALAWWGLGWAATYLLFGVAQHERAYAAAQALADSRGHDGVRLSVKPGFANLLLWKATYEHAGEYHVDGIRAGLRVGVCEGERIEKLDIARHLPGLDPDSQQARDLERFRWFSADWLAIAGPDTVIDVRYSVVPNEIDALWGIRLDPSAPQHAHVEWWSSRQAGAVERAALADLVTGRACERPPTGQSTRS
jgi:inner membrane protein